MIDCHVWIIGLLIFGGALLPDRHKYKLPMLVGGLLLITLTARR